MNTTESRDAPPTLVVVASTYPRWHGDPEPAFVHELSRRFIGRFRVIAVVPDAPGADESGVQDGVEVVRFRYAPRILQTLVNDGGIIANLQKSSWKPLLLPTFAISQWWSVWRLLRRNKVDAIHAHWLLPQGLIAVLACKLTHRAPPVLVTSHGADLFALRGFLPSLLKRFVARNVDMFTVVSEAMRPELARIGARMERVLVRPMGVDLLHVFKPDSLVERADQELLFVGRLVEKKGLRYLIDAMPEVLKSIPDVRLFVVGFGPERTRLENQASSLGLSDKIQFVGPLPQASLPAYYQRATVFVAPFIEAESGDQEGLGLVAAEAAGCACPVIIGDVPGAHGLLNPSCAKFVRPKNTGELAAAIVEVLKDRAGREQRALRARERVLKTIDWNVVSNGYAELIDGIVKSRH
ncbi:glycosyltransferase [Dyella sp. 2HG41-7]|uniref:glycosyltransferase n=1 Tax=Dyella sp. 2HG41-7 TaxID=2883239 RepID=UPI001F1B378E|nr:glycosyltransferase [Dyella sp. 2HG41-7]